MFFKLNKKVSIKLKFLNRYFQRYQFGLTIRLRLNPLVSPFFAWFLINLHFNFWIFLLNLSSIFTKSKHPVQSLKLILITIPCNDIIACFFTEWSPLLLFWFVPCLLELPMQTSLKRTKPQLLTRKGVRLNVWDFAWLVTSFSTFNPQCLHALMP